eukprot:3297935-Prymnesium_polylepis.1
MCVCVLRVDVTSTWHAERRGTRRGDAHADLTAGGRPRGHACGGARQLRCRLVEPLAAHQALAGSTQESSLQPSPGHGVTPAFAASLSPLTRRCHDVARPRGL